MNLSPPFTLAELTGSRVAARQRIDNTPTGAALTNFYVVAYRLETVRELLGGRSILISNGYRSPALNTEVSRSRMSAHIVGLAVDFICSGFGAPLEICRQLAQHADPLDFDQIIQEGTRVHLGLTAEGKAARGQVLMANSNAGGASYSHGS